MPSPTGKAYEQLVAEVVGAMSPGADVQQSLWIPGPDGRRDMDVLVRGRAGDAPVDVLVECKDWNPTSTGPVGIDVVDALESKRRDLPVDVAMICSNGGFTEGAIRKASRVGIGLISILKRGDTRARFEVVVDLYARNLDVAKITVSYLGLVPPLPSLAGHDPLTWRSEGGNVLGWITSRIMRLLGENEVVHGRFTKTDSFVQPMRVDTVLGPRWFDEMTFGFQVTGEWVVMRSRLDSSEAVYDWVRRSVQIGSGPASSLSFGVTLGTDKRFDGRVVANPPPRAFGRAGPTGPGEQRWSLMHVSGLPSDPAGRPNWDEQLSQLSRCVRLPDHLGFSVPSGAAR